MDYQTKMKVKNFLSKPFITYVILGITVIVFLGMELSGGSENKQVLLDWGAMSKDRVVLYHEYWRFFTPMFLHIGWMHIILNMITLYYVGAQVEGVYGHWRYLLIYLTSGLLGNFVSFGFGSRFTISAGASTSIFGLFGALIILGWHFRDNQAIRFMVQRYSVFIGITLLFNLFSSSVDILGHIGGLLGGLLAGTFAAVPKQSENFNIHQRIISVMIIAFIFVVCFFLGFKNYN
ncbi:rhomboid family intramembrane serine protease [Enterococcus sp. BWT-B8]|uniref:rhomboid family intramembrane serine protease n=1 Tax=unclassified Enterococcus TaxID=2608891 RepID=UPI001E53A706|nr:MULTISPECIES: rhomboid family intramembrane serine protease [unclassified Enterococcus]MCB5952217.1 rhomboid family intramembrane serine protease [Enterococcus sp. BWT-B8]MCB5956058.1 rhomboid family intramembrane serine protease [Enterococcus sp. CWB-B31]